MSDSTPIEDRDSIGRCHLCDEMLYRDDDYLVLPVTIAGETNAAEFQMHRACAEGEDYMEAAEQETDGFYVPEWACTTCGGYGTEGNGCAGGTCLDWECTRCGGTGVDPGKQAPWIAADAGED